MPKIPFTDFCSTDEAGIHQSFPSDEGNDENEITSTSSFFPEMQEIANPEPDKLMETRETRKDAIPSDQSFPRDALRETEGNALSIKGVYASCSDSGFMSLAKAFPAHPTEVGRTRTGIQNRFRSEEESKTVDGHLIDSSDNASESLGFSRLGEDISGGTRIDPPPVLPPDLFARDVPLALAGEGNEGETEGNEETTGNERETPLRFTELPQPSILSYAVIQLWHNKDRGKREVEWRITIDADLTAFEIKGTGREHTKRYFVNFTTPSEYVKRIGRMRKSGLMSSQLAEWHFEKSREVPAGAMIGGIGAGRSAQKRETDPKQYAIIGGYDTDKPVLFICCETDDLILDQWVAGKETTKEGKTRSENAAKMIAYYDPHGWPARRAELKALRDQAAKQAAEQSRSSPMVEIPAIEMRSIHTAIQEGIEQATAEFQNRNAMLASEMARIRAENEMLFTRTNRMAETLRRVVSEIEQLKSSAPLVTAPDRPIIVPDVWEKTEDMPIEKTGVSLASLIAEYKRRRGIDD
jgi:hypothetical protein